MSRQIEVSKTFSRHPSFKTKFQKLFSAFDDNLNIKNKVSENF